MVIIKAKNTKIMKYKYSSIKNTSDIIYLYKEGVGCNRYAEKVMNT